MQEKFCVNYFSTSNATQAAIKAGYSPRTAVVIASKTLTLANVQKRLTELRELTISKAVMTVQERREVLTLIGRFGGKTSIQAIAELNKMDGSYAPVKQDITSKGNELKPARIYNLIVPETKALLGRLEHEGRVELNPDISQEPKQLSQPAVQTIT
jgi:phage terminase small subunit